MFWRNGWVSQLESMVRQVDARGLLNFTASLRAQVIAEAGGQRSFALDELKRRTQSVLEAVHADPLLKQHPGASPWLILLLSGTTQRTGAALFKLEAGAAKVSGVADRATNQRRIVFSSEAVDAPLLFRLDSTQRRQVVHAVQQDDDLDGNTSEESRS